MWQYQAVLNPAFRFFMYLPDNLCFFEIPPAAVKGTVEYRREPATEDMPRKSLDSPIPHKLSPEGEREPVALLPNGERSPLWGFGG